MVARQAWNSQPAPGAPGHDKEAYWNAFSNLTKAEHDMTPEDREQYTEIGAALAGHLPAFLWTLWFSRESPKARLDDGDVEVDE
jgi:hypothetical protein